MSTQSSDRRSKMLARVTDDDVVLGMASIAAKLLVEFIGTWLLVLVALIVTALDPIGALAHGVVIGFTAFTLILMAWGSSGGHFNPYITGAFFVLKYMPGGYSLGGIMLAGAYIAVQLFAGLVATWTFMRADPPTLSPTIPTGLLVGDFGGVLLYEFIGVMMLVLVMLQVMRPCGLARKAHWLSALAVGAAYLALVNILTLVGTGASLNLARSLGTALISNIWTTFGAYPLAGVLGAIAAVIVHMVIRCSDDPTCMSRMFEDVLREVRNGGKNGGKAECASSSTSSSSSSSTQRNM